MCSSKDKNTIKQVQQNKFLIVIHIIVQYIYIIIKHLIILLSFVH